MTVNALRRVIIKPVKLIAHRAAHPDVRPMLDVDVNPLRLFIYNHLLDEPEHPGS
jgi:hypothetical protein